MSSSRIRHHLIDRLSTKRGQVVGMVEEEVVLLHVPLAASDCNMVVTSGAGHVYTGVCDGHVHLGNNDRESQWVPPQVAKWSPGRSGA